MARFDPLRAQSQAQKMGLIDLAADRTLFQERNDPLAGRRNEFDLSPQRESDPDDFRSSRWGLLAAIMYGTAAAFSGGLLLPVVGAAGATYFTEQIAKRRLQLVRTALFARGTLETQLRLIRQIQESQKDYLSAGQLFGDVLGTAVAVLGGGKIGYAMSRQVGAALGALKAQGLTDELVTHVDRAAIAARMIEDSLNALKMEGNEEDWGRLRDEYQRTRR